MASSQLRYIGYHDPLAEGKYLLEILCQLRDMGVGRMITKGEWSRRFVDYAPTFARVVQVQPKMDRWMRHGEVLVDWTVCGKPMGLHRLGQRVIDRADWHLVHKHEEKKFEGKYAGIVNGVKEEMDLQRPTSVPLPPLMKIMLAQEAAKTDNPSLAKERLPIKPLLDVEFEVLKDWIKCDKSLDAEENIYKLPNDKGPEVYAKQFGATLPSRIEYWNNHE